MRTWISRTPLLVAVLVAMSGAAFAQDPPDEPAEPGPVVRAVVCTDVVDREPVGEATTFDSGVDQLFCFTQIQGQQGKSITHAWIHEGTTRARVELPVRSPNWRTWSTKQIAPGWTGNWQVKVLDADGIVLSTLDFVVE